MTLQGFSSNNLQGLYRNLQAFGIKNVTPLTFNPYGICVTGDLVYVTDIENNRVVIFDTIGTYVDEFGTTGSGDGQFQSPSDIHTDGTYLYILDSTRIIKHELDGTFVDSISAPSNSVALANTNSGVAVTYYTSSPLIKLKTYDYSLSYVRECISGTSNNLTHINSLTVRITYTRPLVLERSDFYSGDISGTVGLPSPSNPDYVGFITNSSIIWSNDGDLIYLITSTDNLVTFNTTTTSPFAVTLKGAPTESGISKVFFYENEIYCICDDTVDSKKIAVISPSDASTIRDWTL